MGLPQPKPRYTIPEYINREIDAEQKHEYHNGEILAMSGGSPEHALLAANIIRAIGNRLQGKPCRVYTSDLRVAISPSARFVYPDATVVHPPLEIHRDDPFRQSVTNPRLIVEVLSPKTEAYDRGDKFLHYRQLPSFQEYVLVSPYGPLIETFRRRDDGSWLFTPYQGPDASAGLPSIGISIPLAEVFANVDFIPPPAPPAASA
jgi:Uma2 family endonuclease